MRTVLYNNNHINRDDILKYKNLIQEILDGRSQSKKMKGVHYQDKPVYRVKIDKKNRFMFTYVQYEKKVTLLVLAINDHNYGKLKRQLTSKNTKSYESLAIDEESLEVPSIPSESNDLTLTPTISFNQMTLALDEHQQDGIVLHPPVLFCGPPGAGKTALIYNMMLRSITSAVERDVAAYDHSEKEKEQEKEKEKEKESESEQPRPTLFISQSEYSLHLLRGLYRQTLDSETVPVHFTTWEDLLQSHHPKQSKASPEYFAQWLDRKWRNESPKVLHYELSLIKALGREEYLGLASRQCHYSNNCKKQYEIIRLLKQWEEHLDEKQLFDPMVSTLNLDTPLYRSIFGDEMQNLPPNAIAQLAPLAQNRNFTGCVDTEQCITSSPYIQNLIQKVFYTCYKGCTEHDLPRTWRCPIDVAATGNHLMNKKYELDGTGKRRPYTNIVSALDEKGLVSWVDNEGLSTIKHHGSSSGTVVIADSPTTKERDTIKQELGAHNILNPGQVIGSDFDVVILWKPISENKALTKLGKEHTKRQTNLSLEELNALNALYVSVTRSQNTVFVYEPHMHLRNGWGTELLGTLPLNQTSPFENKDNSEQNQTKWMKRVEEYLQIGETTLATNIMKSLKMTPSEIKKTIAALTIKKEVIYQQTPPAVLSKPPASTNQNNTRRQMKKVSEKLGKAAKKGASKTHSRSRKSAVLMKKENQIPSPSDSEQKIIASLFNDFNSKRLEVVLKLFTQDTEAFLRCFLYKGYWGTNKNPCSLIDFIQQDRNRCTIFLSCLTNLPVCAFNNTPLEILIPHLTENKFFHDQVSLFADALKKIGVSWIDSICPLQSNHPEEKTDYTGGETAIWVAAEKGQTDVLETLHQLGADVNKANSDGETPAHIAAYNGHLSVLERLRKWRVDLNCTDKYGVTPAFNAAEEGHLSVLRSFKKWDVDLSKADNEGVTLASVAARNKRLLVLKKLNDWRVDLNQADKNGRTPAYVAVENGHIEVLVKLKSWEADLNKPDNNGNTLVHVAAQKGSIVMIELLHQWGLDLNHPNILGLTATFIAANDGNIQLLEKLHDLKVDFNKVSNEGYSPAQIAVYSKRINVLEKLTLWGLDLDKYDKHGLTLTHYAVKLGSLSVLKALKELGADVYKTDSLGCSLANIATQKGHMAILELLREWKVDFNQASAQGFTPVFAAAQNGHVTIMKKLIEWGANVNEATNQGAIPIFIAAQNGFKEIVALLIANGAEVSRPFTSSQGKLVHFCKPYPAEVMARMKEFIEAQLKGTGNDDDEVTLLPIDIARIMGHEDIALMINQSDKEQRKKGAFSFFPLTTRQSLLPLNVTEEGDCFQKMVF